MLIKTEISDIYNIYFEFCWFNFPLEYSFLKKNNKTKLLLLWFPCDSKPISSSYRCSINCRVCCWYQYICVLKKNRRMLYCESLPIYHACMNLISIGCNMIKSFNTYFKLQIPINDDKKPCVELTNRSQETHIWCCYCFWGKIFHKKLKTQTAFSFW